MRIARALIAAAALVAAMPRIGTAQLGSSFNNAWFWGVKAGAMDFNSATTSHRQAPLGGIEWLITRSHGGLYVSYSEAFFTDQAAILTGVDPSDTIPRIINLKNMRRLDVDPAAERRVPRCESRERRRTAGRRRRDARLSPIHDPGRRRSRSVPSGPRRRTRCRQRRLLPDPQPPAAVVQARAGPARDRACGA